MRKPQEEKGSTSLEHLENTDEEPVEEDREPGSEPPSIAPSVLEASVMSSPSAAEKLPFIDRWWAWVIFGLGFAAFMGILHVSCVGTGR